ncbi:unnamed protein product [Prorocentrum cordatum]|nr:unnamed protein product [Polarella glacialis]
MAGGAGARRAGAHQRPPRGTAQAGAPVSASGGNCESSKVIVFEFSHEYELSNSSTKRPGAGAVKVPPVLRSLMRSGPLTSTVSPPSTSKWHLNIISMYVPPWTVKP